MEGLLILTRDHRQQRRPCSVFLPEGGPECCMEGHSFGIQPGHENREC